MEGRQRGEGGRKGGREGGRRDGRRERWKEGETSERVREGGTVPTFSPPVVCSPPYPRLLFAPSISDFFRLNEVRSPPSLPTYIPPSLPARRQTFCTVACLRPHRPCAPMRFFLARGREPSACTRAPALRSRPSSTPNCTKIATAVTALHARPSSTPTCTTRGRP